MTIQAIPQAPISLQARRKWDVRTQFAALCYRQKGAKSEVLLVTSRGTGRWIIPKGWPMDGRTPGEAALIEAWEEAGVQGVAFDQCLGVFAYRKAPARGRRLPCLAMVYPVKVERLASRFPEAGQRKRKWLSPRKAAARLSEPELARIVRHFDPRDLPGPGPTP